jgi:putative transposase
VNWYNSEHRHSAIRYITPDERHSGREVAILARRHALYEYVRSRKPERWPRNTRNLTPLGTVVLNPEPNDHDSEIA